jgi:hypothetical protein
MGQTTLRICNGVIMSIDDDYFDLKEFVEGTEVEDSFDRFSTRLAEEERENHLLRKRNHELETTFRTLMGLKDDKLT